MAARRDEITGKERLAMGLAILSPERAYGTMTKLSDKWQMSRQALYAMAVKLKDGIETLLSPGPHGPVAETPWVDDNRLKRMTVVLCECGVSQRGTQKCLSEGLDANMSLGWVNKTLYDAEKAAARVNAMWQPKSDESLSGDEIYSQDQPNLLLVGNESTYVYGLTRQLDCTGETWGCVLLDHPTCPQFNSDAGVGLASGVKQAGLLVHQLDWDHVIRPMWGQVCRGEAQAYAAIAAYEARLVLYKEAKTPGRLAQHLAVLNRLAQEMQEKITRADDFRKLAEQVDAEFGLIEINSGRVRNPDLAAQRLQVIGQLFKQWTGVIYQKVGSYFSNLSTGLFAYVPRLQSALQPLFERWGTPAILALSRIWQYEADIRRHPRSDIECQRIHKAWATCLDDAFLVLGDQLWLAWDEISAILGKVWRGSSLAECINSKLRPVLNRRDQTDQGCLDLFRFLHNSRVYNRGKRAGYSPAQLVNLDVPDDPLTLLGFSPKVSI
jgi:hypothetical protein